MIKNFIDQIIKSNIVDSPPRRKVIMPYAATNAIGSNDLVFAAIVIVIMPEIANIAKSRSDQIHTCARALRFCG